MKMKAAQFQLEITGLGIIFYSPHAVEHIPIGEHYLMEHYNKPEDVVKHIYDGSIVGFCTGTPGTFILKLYGDMDINSEFDELKPDYAIKLCLQVTDNTVYFRDLYALLRWEKETDADIKIDMENGCYEVIVFSWLPESGIRGDHQRINLYFNKTDSLPKLRYAGVPAIL